MTREEAVDALDNLIGMIDDNQDTDYDDALRMAIEALKQPEITTGDLISRQAAINEFKCCELTPDGGIDANYAVEFLAQLPSAQSDKDINVPNTDCISRQDAIDAVYESAVGKQMLRGHRDLITILKHLPSAQPDYDLSKYSNKLWKSAYERGKAEAERKTGRWILVNDTNGQHCVCEFCGEWKYHQKQKFCGECGSRMMEVEHE